MHYGYRVGSQISILINVILGGAQHQSISARNYQLKREGRKNLVWLIDKIFFFETNHCQTSWVYWMTNAIIYGKEQCTYCKQAMKLAEQLAVEYEYRDVGEDPALLAELKEKVPGVRTVPQIFVEGKHVGGYEDFVKYMRENSSH